MAMQFSFNIQPFGDRTNEFPFATMRVVSRGGRHEYILTYRYKDEWRGFSGALPKTRSGHRNFLHLLQAILTDIDLDSLGKNYVDIFDEIIERYPHLELSRDMHPEYRET